MKRMGISVEEKGDVEEIIKSLISRDSATKLTAEGVRLLHAYASGGYEYLAEQRNVKPYSAEEFVRDYASVLGKAVETEGVDSDVMRLVSSLRPGFLGLHELGNFRPKGRFARGLPGLVAL